MAPIFMRSFAVLVPLAGTALALGAALDPNAGWIVFTAGLLALLAFHVRNLRALLRWLAYPDPDNVPGSSGAWDDALALLHRRERSHAADQQRLARLLVRYRQASRALPDSVVILDADNRIQWCNEKARTHFGIDADADIGRPITNLVRHPEFVDYITAGDYGSPVQVRNDHGTARVLEAQIIPYEDAQKLLMARDVTQAERLDQIRRDFVANVSHELRTPLTVMAGFLETVRELKLDPQRRRDYLDMMADQSRRMQRLLDDLLTLSSLESSPEPGGDERIVTSRLLARTRADAEQLSAGRHRIGFDAAGDYDLLGSETEIASAFGNLVSNAIRYTPAGGEIRLLWRASAQGASFSVEDTGIGIERQHVPRLTERFYRVDRGRSRETGGTGLGLAIVKHALLRHQATLEIQSEPGRGSRFTARFPARRIVAAPPSSEVHA